MSSNFFNFIFIFLVCFCLQANAKIIQGSKTFTTDNFFGFKTFESIQYEVFIPETPAVLSPAQRPLVVALHGCQRAADFIQMSQLKLWAEKYNFILLFPEQQQVNNPPFRCWNWFLPNNLHPESPGELSTIHDLTKEIQQKYSADPKKTFVLGLSSGGAMSLNLAYCFANTYSGVASYSSVPYNVSESFLTSFSSMNSAPEFDPQQLARSAFACQTNPEPRQLQKFLFVQGTEDPIVNPGHLKYVQNQSLGYVAFLEQGQPLPPLAWTEKVENTPEQGTRYAYEKSDFQFKNYHIISYKVEGMAHALAGGTEGVLFSDPKGPPAVIETLKLFEIIPSTESAGSAL